MNESFIRAQQRLGITIAYPSERAILSLGKHTVRGTFTNPPARDVFAMTYVQPDESALTQGGWWPQEPLRIIPNTENEWEADVQFGAPGRLAIHIVKANELGRGLIDFYSQLKEIRARVISDVSNLYCRDLQHVLTHIAPSFWSLPLSSKPPKGLDVEATVNVRVVE